MPAPCVHPAARPRSRRKRPGPRAARRGGPSANRRRSPARSWSAAAPCTTRPTIDRARRHRSPRCAAPGGRRDWPIGGSSRARRTRSRSASSWYPDRTRSPDRRTATAEDRASESSARARRESAHRDRWLATLAPAHGPHDGGLPATPAAGPGVRRPARCPRRRDRRRSARTRTPPRHAAASQPAAGAMRRENSRSAIAPAGRMPRSASASGAGPETHRRILAARPYA